jgi:CDP-diacylglycerol--glycerol-3-phosphate 3-phosphatidyltransferase
MLEKKLRPSSAKAVDLLALFCLRRGVTPFTVTLAGIGVSSVGAILVAFDQMVAGATVFLVGSALDAVDGALARLSGRASIRGAFLDSVLDRVAELALLAGVFVHLMGRDDAYGMLLVFVLAQGSLLVSYLRARAEGLGVNGRGGLMERSERVLLFVLVAISGPLRIQVLLLGCVLVLGTCVWRGVLVWRRLGDTR